MSKTIKIQSLKNGSSVIKVKTVANEKYIIADETGKVKEIRYDLISEPVMDPVSDTIPLDPLEY